MPRPERRPSTGIASPAIAIASGIHSDASAQMHPERTAVSICSDVGSSARTFFAEELLYMVEIEKICGE